MSYQLLIELRVMARQPWQWLGLITGALTMYVMLHFGIPPHAPRAQVLPALLLGAMVITLVNFGQHAFSEDAYYGRIAHWQYGPLTLGAIVTCKLLVYMFSGGMPLALLFGLFSAQSSDVGGVAVGAWAFSSLVLGLCAMAILACSLLSGAMGVCFRQSRFTGYLLTLPFLFSLVIFAATALVAPAGDDEALSLLAIFSLVLTPLCCWLTAFVLRMAG